MKRVYHHFSKLEDLHGGMWRDVLPQERDGFAIASRDLMLDHDKFFRAMIVAIDSWPFSCEHNLTCASVNRQAFLGHIGCCVAHKSPEDCTRQGWRMMNEVQQADANRAADEAFQYWLNKYEGKANA